MYAVIEAGGKQERVEVGQRVDVELLRARPGDEVSFRPVLVVDGDTVLATPEGLHDASVAGTVVGEKLGPKIDGFTYKAKTRSRRRFGHRQRYTTVQISSIDSESYSLHASLASLAAEAERDTPAQVSAVSEARDTAAAAADVVEPEVAEPVVAGSSSEQEAAADVEGSESDAGAENAGTAED
jgi:large subunit ribosomal protein L21